MNTSNDLDGFLQQEVSKANIRQQTEDEHRECYLDFISCSLSAVKTAGIAIPPEATDQYVAAKLMEERFTDTPIRDIEILEESRITLNLLRRVLLAVLANNEGEEESLAEAVRLVNIDLDTTTQEKVTWIRAIEIATRRIMLTEDDDVSKDILDATRESDRLIESINNQRERFFEELLNSLMQEIIRKFGEHDNAEMIAILVTMFPYSVNDYIYTSKPDDASIELFAEMKELPILELSNSYIPEEELLSYIERAVAATVKFEASMTKIERGHVDEG
jgi:hypothetical protein